MTPQSGGGAHEIPDYLVPVAPRRPESPQEHDVPLYQAPLPVTEQHEGGAEYERLQLYETVGL